MQSQTYVFLAGGMGITPFRSMIAQRLQQKDKLNATLFYFAPSQEELLFQDEFQQAVSHIGITFVPVLYDAKDSKWTGLTGRFSEEILKKYVDDMQKPIYYISGSESFINATREILSSLHISEEQMKTDVFSGY